MTTTAIATSTEYRTLSDWQLKFLAGRLEQKIACMHNPQTTAAARVLQDYREKLDAAYSEIERRRT